MLEILVFAVIALAFIFVAIAEHKQKMQQIEFEEKIAWMRYQMEHRDTGIRSYNYRCRDCGTCWNTFPTIGELPSLKVDTKPCEVCEAKLEKLAQEGEPNE